MMDYTVNLPLLKALALLRGTYDQATIGHSLLAVFDPAGKGTPITANPLFCALNSYSLAIGTAHADLDDPADLVSLWTDWEGSISDNNPGHKAFISIESLEVVSKLAPKNKQDRAIFEKGCSLNIQKADIGADYNACLVTPEWRGQTAPGGSFPRISQLFGTTAPGPTQDVAFSIDVMGKVLAAAKMVGADTVCWHGGGDPKGREPAKVKHFWSIRSDAVLIVGLIMPVFVGRKWQ